MARKASSRAKVKGTLERHGRVWRARWMVDGELYVRSTGESKKREALKKLDEFTAPFKAKSDGDKIKELSLQVQKKDDVVKSYEDTLPAMPLLCFFAHYRKTPPGKKASTDTASMYESQFNRMIDWMKDHHPEINEARGINRKVAQEFMDFIEAKFSPNTHNKYCTLFTAMWDAVRKSEEITRDEAGQILTEDDAKKYARLTGNPWQTIPKLQTKSSSTTRRELTIEELTKIGMSVSGEMRTLYALGIYTGLRLADCVLMDWGHIDLVRNIIIATPRKTKNKTGAEVRIPIHNALRAILTETDSQKRSGLVLPGLAKEYNHNRGEFCKKVNSVFAQCGIERQAVNAGKRAACIVGFHSLRHTFVSLAANAGISLELVKQIVGHGNPRMTEHYVHASTGALQSVVNTIPAIGELSKPKELEAPATDAHDLPDPLMSQFKQIIAKMDSSQRKMALKTLTKLTSGDKT